MVRQRLICIFRGMHFALMEKRFLLAKTTILFPFNITPPENPEPLEYDETDFLESLAALIEGYDLVLSILRWEDLVRLQRVFEVERATTLIFFLAKAHEYVVNKDLPNVHVVETGSSLRRSLHTTNWAMKGAVLRRLCEAACCDGFQVFKQVKQDPQQLIEIVQNQ